MVVLVPCMDLDFTRPRTAAIVAVVKLLAAEVVVVVGAARTSSFVCLLACFLERERESILLLYVYMGRNGRRDSSLLLEIRFVLQIATTIDY